jgi:hypothetical protein
VVPLLLVFTLLHAQSLAPSFHSLWFCLPLTCCTAAFEAIPQQLCSYITTALEVEPEKPVLVGKHLPHAYFAFCKCCA